MKRFFLCVCLMMAVAMPGISPVMAPAIAQDMRPPVDAPPLPIEIKMLYMKLLGQKPDYDAIIQSGAAYQENPARFANQAIMDQQRGMLKELYDRAGPDHAFVVQKDMKFMNVDVAARTADTQPIPFDEPIVFSMSPDEKYGLFLRNSKEIEHLSPPYEFDELLALRGMAGIDGYLAPVRLTVVPLAADPEDFPLANGDKVKVILAKIVAINVDSMEGDRLVLSKKLNRPEATIPLPDTTKIQNGNSLPPARVAY